MAHKSSPTPEPNILVFLDNLSKQLQSIIDSLKPHLEGNTILEKASEDLAKLKDEVDKKKKFAENRPPSSYKRDKGFFKSK